VSGEEEMRRVFLHAVSSLKQSAQQIAFNEWKEIQPKIQAGSDKLSPYSHAADVVAMQAMQLVRETWVTDRASRIFDASIQQLGHILAKLALTTHPVDEPFDYEAAAEFLGRAKAQQEGS